MRGAADGAARPRAELAVDGTQWHAYEAWRASSGLGLVYFLRADDGPGDRRASVEGGRSLEELGSDELEALWREAHELTATERRIRDARGDAWLVQATGPVWAEAGSAADTVGVRARCVTADRGVRERGGVRPDSLSDQVIQTWLDAEPVTPG